MGRKIGSAALVADGRHARTDGLTSLAVVLGAIGVAAGAQVAASVVGLVITVAILRVLNDAARDIYRRLMDSVEPGLVDAVERILTDVSGVEAVETVRIRWVGHQLRAEATIISDADLSLADAHAIAEEVHHRLLHEIPGWPRRPSTPTPATTTAATTTPRQLTTSRHGNDSRLQWAGQHRCPPGRRHIPSNGSDDLAALTKRCVCQRPRLLG